MVHAISPASPPTEAGTPRVFGPHSVGKPELPMAASVFLRPRARCRGSRSDARECAKPIVGGPRARTKSRSNPTRRSPDGPGDLPAAYAGAQSAASAVRLQGEVGIVLVMMVER